MPDFYLPYLINYSQPVVDEIVVFCIAMLLAVVVSAESQAFMATLLGDSRPGAKDRLNFNVFMHLSVLGTLNFFIAGFGWAKEIDIDPTKFKRNPRLSLILSRMSGPLANLLMANIAASLAWILGRYGVVDHVFSRIVVVNVTMAVYGLFFVPPLPGGVIWYALFPAGSLRSSLIKYLRKFGPAVIVLSFLFIRLTGWDGVSDVMSPVVSGLSSFLFFGG